MSAATVAYTPFLPFFSPALRGTDVHVWRGFYSKNIRTVYLSRRSRMMKVERMPLSSRCRKGQLRLLGPNRTYHCQSQQGQVLELPFKTSGLRSC